jgi:hypothetical protein
MSYRAFLNHFGNMTHTHDNGKFRDLPDIGNFFATLRNKKLYTYLVLLIISGFKKQSYLINSQAIIFYYLNSRVMRIFGRNFCID